MMKHLTAASRLSYTPEYMTVDEKPFFPVMGEMHYSRVPAHRWKTELLKMKAGGVQIVSVYTIWIHHEEVEGEWNFSGNRNLRKFLKTVQECGMYCFLRIGPWIHGEVRNGGFPDWLMEMEKLDGVRLRTNDVRYLGFVRRFYDRIFEEVRGLLISDEGPVMGIQIENEYGHCGGLQGEEGEAHMRTLKNMAQSIGFQVPIYTATGWGGAVTGGMLPVMGGYCEAPWDPRTTELEPSGNYVFTKERNDHNIGSDHGIGEGITFDQNQFPYLTAELGGGLQVTRQRRPVASAKDIAVMTWVKLGSGCNLLGYYMYHGGTNPEGEYSTLQESTATGGYSDLPVKSYDFQAPIREFGQLSDTYREIRRISMFAEDYEELLCRTSFVEQPDNPNAPTDLTSIRSALRVSEDQKSGFFFYNNYQRRYPMAKHMDVKLKAYDLEGAVLTEFPSEVINDGDYGVYTFGMPIGESARLTVSNLTPLCILHGEEGNTYVFYTMGEKAPIYQIEGDLQNHRIMILTDQEALHAVKCRKDGREYLVISQDDLVSDANGDWQLIARIGKERKPRIAVYPNVQDDPAGFKMVRAGSEQEGILDRDSFTEYELAQELKNPVRAEIDFVGQTGSGEMTASVSVRRIPSFKEEKGIQVDETLLLIDYDGDTAEISSKGELIADHFYTGEVWEMGCSDRAEYGICTFDLKIHPLTEDTEVFLEKQPEMENGKACRLNSLNTRTIYKVKL